MADSPSVLVVLVAKDGSAWLPRSLASLARQTHPRLGVVAVDNGSADGSGDLLSSALTEKRVIRLEENVGLPAAVNVALRTRVAQKADYVLVLHDDTALAPNAVAALVEAAESTPGAGIVGPKVIDWQRPLVLREVGMTTDRFGYPYSPLEEDEIDQGQHDAQREVLFVSSVAMLVSRDAWKAAGAHDERMAPAHGDLDFCWRVRLAGYRVLVNPAAVVLHHGAGTRGDRRDSHPDRARYLAERALLATILKNYGFVSLLWVLPAYGVQGLLRLLALVLSRRFAGAGLLILAWGWNAGHLLGTVQRRARAQAVRRLRDREVMRLMSPAGARFRRWLLQASAPLAGGTATHLEDEDVLPDPLGRRVGGMALAHPVVVAAVLAVLVFVPAFREVLFGRTLGGGALPAFPERPQDLLRVFASGWTVADLGGPTGGSPALVPLSLLSFATLADPTFLARLLVAATPVLAGASLYRAAVARTKVPAAAVAGAACYALSALTLWTASEGRVGTAVFLIAAPWFLVRLGEPFEAAGPKRPLRWAVGTAMGLAAAVAFFPAAWIAALLAAVLAWLTPGSWRGAVRGPWLAGAAALLASALVFPFVLGLVQAGGGAAVGAAGEPDAGALLRLAPGPAPGSWPVALFLPVAAVLAFPVASDRRWTWRLMVGAAISLPLAWLAAAGRLPPPVSNPIAYLGVAAPALSMVVGLGVAGLLKGFSGQAFGYRQVAVGALGTVIGVGLLLQSAQALVGSWAVGHGRIPPAWPVVATAEGPPFRVLWIGRPGGRAFPPPGGPPDGQVEAGEASVRYGLTGPGGHSINELGVPASGPGYPALERALRSILRGGVRHGGALLAPFGIRFVVAGPGDLPEEVADSLESQLDLDLIQTAGGLSIFESPRAFPVAVAVGADGAGAARSDEVLAPVRGVFGEAEPLRPAPGGWAGMVPLGGSGAVLVATQYDPRWRLSLDGQTVRPFRSFGWAVGFDATFPTPSARVRFGGQPGRSLEVAAMGLLWAGALWLTRRRGTRAPLPGVGDPVVRGIQTAGPLEPALPRSDGGGGPAARASPSAGGDRVP